MNKNPGQRMQGQGRRGPGMGGGMHMGMPVEKPKDFKGTSRRLVGYLGPHRKKLVVVLVMAMCSTVFGILGPKILGKAITRLFQGIMMVAQRLPGAAVDYPYIARILLVLVGLYIFSSLFNFLMQYVMAGVAQRTVYDLRRDLQEKLSHLPLKYFDSRPHGDILSRMTNDIDTIGATLQQSLTQIISSVITLIGIIVMMLTISPLLTLVTILVLPLSLIGARFITKRSQKFFADQQRHLGMLNGHIEEMYTGHAVMKAYGREEESIAKFSAVNEELYGAGWRAQFMSGIIMPVLSFINNIGYVIVCVVGGILATRRLIELGDIQAFIQYSRQFSQPIVQVANIANVLQATIASAERVFEVLDETLEIQDVEDPVELRPEQTKGRVDLESVDFRYVAEKPLITNMDLSVAPGSSIAIVGPTGAGKTTLVNLLMRFYELDGGTIRIDGVPTTQMRRGDLRRIFGMVLQDTWLFNGTIRENIAYGKEGATDEDVYAVARAAHADHFIRSLPEGYDTLLNEEASNISQGQRQLITIARAFLADPVILILDEATSNVDTRTEVIVQQAMADLMKDRTSFVIAHRLSTIRNANHILVMEEGTIVEQGTHDSLMQAQGAYAELYRSQFLALDEEVAS